jgi:hypothetical protein
MLVRAHPTRQKRNGVQGTSNKKGPCADYASAAIHNLY